jgi:hypothetical protein
VVSNAISLFVLQTAPVSGGQDSVLYRNRRLATMIANGDVGTDVLNEVLPTGCAHPYEKSLWDYKIKLPFLPQLRKPTDEEKIAYAAEMAEVVKDVVAFYNSHGGYLVIGIDDKTREVLGFDETFDCGDLGKKIYAATKHEIDCHFKRHTLDLKGASRIVCLLLIPRRPDSKDAAQFRRDSPAAANGKQAYRAEQIYFRRGDSCIPAHASEDFTFLCSPERRTIIGLVDAPRYSALENNLGPRDPGFIKFIGREAYLRELWRWLCDPFSPVKLLAGLGGVGKTTLVREFVEDIVASPPSGLQKVVWLSAKRQLYTASLGQYRPTSRVDFTDTPSLLRAILAELGTPSESVEPEASQQDLMEEVVSSLRILPSLVVIDDVDSLAPEQQQDVFHTTIRMIDQTLGSGCETRSRALLTARLDLGAAPSQLVRVRGLEREDFFDYVRMTAESHELPWTQKNSSDQMRRFYEITDGSPTFAASIIRLVSLGQTLDSALSKWKGADGEEVRRFAFEKELTQLADSQLRTLYAACLLGETSAVELQHVLQSSETLLGDDIGQLRKFHLVALGSELPGGPRIELPTSIQLLADLIRKKIHDPNWLERECEKIRDRQPDPSSDVGRVTARVVALWKDNKAREALDLTVVAKQQFPAHPDLECLLGRAYLKLSPSDVAKADVAFHRAWELKCSRPELLPMWLQTKANLRDWMGILDITKDLPSIPNIVIARGRAYSALAEIALKTTNYSRAAEHYLAGGKYVLDSLQRAETRGRQTELKLWKDMLFQSYVHVVDRDPQRDEDRINVWLACVAVFRYGAGEAKVLSIGARSLDTWWSAVEKRARRDEKALRIMQQQLRVLHNLIGDVIAQENRSAEEDVLRVQSLATELQGRCNRYTPNVFVDE